MNTCQKLGLSLLRYLGDRLSIGGRWVYRQRNLVERFFSNSNSSEASQTVTKRPHELSRRRQIGSGKNLDQIGMTLRPSITSEGNSA